MSSCHCCCVNVCYITCSDGEPMPVIRARPLADNHLTPSPTLLTSDGAESVGVSDHTHLTQLYQLVLNQQREIAVLREEQQQGFAALHQQLEGVQRNTMEEQRSALGHHAREQRIHTCRHNSPYPPPPPLFIFLSLVSSLTCFHYT